MPVIRPIWRPVIGRMSATGIGVAAIAPASVAAAPVILRAALACAARTRDRRAICTCALCGSTSTRYSTRVSTFQ